LRHYSPSIEFYFYPSIFYNPTRDLFTISQIGTKNGYLKIRRGLFFSVLREKKKKLQKQKNLKGEKFPLGVLF